MSGFLDFMHNLVTAVDGEVKKCVDSADRAVGAALDAGDHAMKHHLMNPVGDLVGTLVGDRNCAARTIDRMLGEIVGVNPNDDDD